MIISMKKISIVVQKKDAQEALMRLRDIGVVHVQHENIPENVSISETKEEIQKLQDAINFLEGQGAAHVPQSSGQKEMIDRIIECIHQIRQIEDDMAKRNSLINQWELWGDFNPQELEKFSHHGFCAGLFKIPVKEVESLPKDVVCEKIFVKEKIAHCFVLCKEKKSLGFQQVHLPSLGLSEMKDVQAKDAQKIQNIKNELKRYYPCLSSFKHFLGEKQSDFRLKEALAGMGQDQELSYLVGFCPANVCIELQNASRKEKWGLVIEDPSDDDKIPTLLRNPKWVNMIKPVFSMMNILPGYKEFDISVFFLVFLSVFFGILIGDAGYGAIFFLATLIAHIKLNKKMKDKAPLFLMYTLSACAIVWGLLTGTIFGQEWIKGIFDPLLPWLTDTENMQMLCFLIGAIHLSIAHIWRAILKMPSFSALSEVGWISILWGMFFVAKMLILSDPLPEVGKLALLVGSGLVVFFSQPKRNIFKTVGLGLGELLMSIVNMFTDIVSYIRLFAVGLATVAVADAFNQMALGIGFNSFFAGLATAMILVLGHVLNIALGAMAILVHGIRLNVLEFSSHLNMEWAGIAYNPFRKVEEIKN
ncbi:MAG: hypothetical protein PHY73_00760 [Candidatus Omnitrophica bacterium]|nr:hypothetical protein [Candidatus Omnitrophota bacterium]